eukprot:4896449-Alexandrium_andersonii.AAC.1
MEEFFGDLPLLRPPVAVRQPCLLRVLPLIGTPSWNCSSKSDQRESGQAISKTRMRTWATLFWMASVFT